MNDVDIQQIQENKTVLEKIQSFLKILKGGFRVTFLYNIHQSFFY